MTLTTSAAANTLIFEKDPRQIEVIEAGSAESLLVVAGPGTGKTQVAAMRLVHLLWGGLRPGQILVLSFSRSAVATLTKRIRTLQLDDEETIEDLRHLSIRTFDSWAFRMLRQTGVPAADLLSQSHDENIAALTTLIMDKSRNDITDRLASIRHVIVDEFQDLPGVRSEMVIALLLRLTGIQDHPVGFTVLGDPAQAIFRFAARLNGRIALPDPWQDLKSSLGKGIREIVLSKNYRSTVELAGLATNMRKILQSNEIEPEKKLAAMQRLLDKLPTLGPDAKLGPSWLGQIPDGSIAILTRTNGEAMRVAKMMMGESVGPPAVSVRLRLAGWQPAPPAWVAILFARFKPQSITRATFDVVYSRSIENLAEQERASLYLPPVDIAWRRLARASGDADSTTAIDLNALRERINWPDSFPDDQIPDEAAIYIMTIHHAKGMEFDNVALLESKASEGRAPNDDPLEQANVGFVAITRAGRHLGRLPATCIYQAPHQWEWKGRTRQLSIGPMFNFQIGISGDLEPSSFVNSLLHGGDDQVGVLQKALGERIAELRGHKVFLKRAVTNLLSTRVRDTLYDIHLQDDTQSGLMIGRTTSQLTHDLLKLLWAKGNHLPSNIYNLRIADVVTVAGGGDIPESVPDPWRSSRLWLGISLTGTGDFKTGKRNGN